MSSIKFLGLVCAFVVILGASIQAGSSNEAGPCGELRAYEGTYWANDCLCEDSCDGTFTTYLWRERLFDGDHGQEANELMAVGPSFIFQGAKRTGKPSFEELDPPSKSWGYRTTYTGGELILNSRGPWLDCGRLVATDVKATNTSWYDAAGNLNFHLTFAGEFDNCDCTYTVNAWFDATYMPYQKAVDKTGSAVLHSGRDFPAEIVINCGNDGTDSVVR